MSFPMLAPAELEALGAGSPVWAFVCCANISVRLSVLPIKAKEARACFAFIYFPLVSKATTEFEDVGNISCA
jgi:hypothetical protein